MSLPSKDFCSTVQLLNSHVLFPLTFCPRIPQPTLLQLPCRPTPQSLHQGKSRRNPKSHIEVIRERGGCHCEHTALLPSLFPSLFLTPPCWGDGWRIQIPLFYHTQCFLSLEASMPVNTPHPGTLPPTPRGLIKSSFLTNYVLSLRGILRNQISPSHN